MRRSRTSCSSMVKAFARVLAAGGFLLMAFQSGTDERVERRTRRRRLDPARGAAGMKVVVADDQTAVRDGLITILEHLDGIEVVGAAADGATAVALAEQHVSHDVSALMKVLVPRPAGWLAPLPGQDVRPARPPSLASGTA